MRKAPAPLLHIPTCIGAVAIIYHLADNPEIRLTPDILADIFLGKIKSWTDSRIRAVNPGLTLSPLRITVIHRSEGSGTTFMLTDYLFKVSPSWRKSVGTGKTVRWPAGLGVEGNAGAAGIVKKIPGSIGYVSLNYAVKNKLAGRGIAERLRTIHQAHRRGCFRCCVCCSASRRTSDPDEQHGIRCVSHLRLYLYYRLS